MDASFEELERDVQEDVPIIGGQSRTSLAEPRVEGHARPRGLFRGKKRREVSLLKSFVGEEDLLHDGIPVGQPEKERPASVLGTTVFRRRKGEGRTSMTHLPSFAQTEKTGQTASFTGSEREVLSSHLQSSGLGSTHTGAQTGTNMGMSSTVKEFFRRRKSNAIASRSNSLVQSAVPAAVEPNGSSFYSQTNKVDASTQTRRVESPLGPQLSLRRGVNLEQEVFDMKSDDEEMVKQIRLRAKMTLLTEEHQHRPVKPFSRWSLEVPTGAGVTERVDPVADATVKSPPQALLEDFKNLRRSQLEKRKGSNDAMNGGGGQDPSVDVLDRSVPNGLLECKHLRRAQLEKWRVFSDEEGGVPTEVDKLGHNRRKLNAAGKSPAAGTVVMGPNERATSNLSQSSRNRSNLSLNCSFRSCKSPDPSHINTKEHRKASYGGGGDVTKLNRVSLNHANPKSTSERRRMRLRVPSRTLSNVLWRKRENTTKDCEGEPKSDSSVSSVDPLTPLLKNEDTSHVKKMLDKLKLINMLQSRGQPSGAGGTGVHTSTSTQRSSTDESSTTEVTTTASVKVRYMIQINQLIEMLKPDRPEGEPIASDSPLPPQPSIRREKGTAGT